MATEALTGRVLRWGNSYGIRLHKADIERLGLQPGDLARIQIEGAPDRVDLSGLPTFRSGASDVSERHDEYLAEGRAAELERRRAPKPRKRRAGERK